MELEACKHCGEAYTGHFIFIDAKPINAPRYGERFHFQCISLQRYNHLDQSFETPISLGQWV